VTAQPFLIGKGWMEVKDGDDTGRAIFDRHYSRYVYADGRKPKLYVGPGEKMVLLQSCARALLVWRKFISNDGQDGVNCAIFRNEGAGVASEMLKDGMARAFERWPGERLYTYVDPREVEPTYVRGHPTWGFCFVKAGWRFVGWTKARKLMIFHFLPEWWSPEALTVAKVPAAMVKP
jgi:hypothetical protein